MELKPQYVFHQLVNDVSGYSLVLLDEEVHVEEITDLDELEDDEIVPVDICAEGRVISMDHAESIWEEESSSLCIVENPLPQGINETAALREFEPLEHFTGLFRAFAETPITPTGFLEFAHKFGFLTDRDETGFDFGYVIVPELYGVDTPIHAEPLVYWFEQIVKMREAVTLWDLARAGDAKGLSKYLRWKNGVLCYWTDHQGLDAEFSLIFDMDNSAKQELDFREGDVIEPAIFLAELITNLGLEGRVRPQFRMMQDKTVRLVTNPLDLLGALWLQLARAIDGNKDYRGCQHCRTWFEIGTTGYSRARRFCSNRCRVAFSRAQKKAKEKDQ